MAVCAGDLATADNVAVVVPGFGTDGAAAAYQGRVLSLYEASRTLDGEPDQRLDVLDRVRRPDNDALGRRLGRRRGARRGDGHPRGRRLADTIDGLRAARDEEPAHLTVIGHSYGSTTLGHGAHDHGLPADDLVLVGSPGAGGATDHAWTSASTPATCGPGANSRDPVAHLGNHGWWHLESALGGAGLGDDPAEDDFGAHRFEAESTTRADNDGFAALGDHSKYFDHDTESLYNIAQVVNGRYAAVREAGHVTDPWYSEPRDPVGPRPDRPGHRRQADRATRPGGGVVSGVLVPGLLSGLVAGL